MAGKQMIVAENRAVTCYGGRNSEWNGAVLDACPTLGSGCRPPLWARNPHVQNLLTTVRDQVAASVCWDVEERIVTKDGGTVSIQWVGLDEPADTPVVLVMHTICGSADTLRRFVIFIRRRLGWVVAACNRRGHAGLPLTAPQINTMGSTSDLREQLASIEARRPMLVINAADDPVCVVQNVHEHRGALQALPHLTLALTARGSHCGFFDGPLARESWAYRAVVGYLAAAHRLIGAQFETSLNRP